MTSHTGLSTRTKRYQGSSSVIQPLNNKNHLYIVLAQPCKLQKLKKLMLGNTTNLVLHQNRASESQQTAQINNVDGTLLKRSAASCLVDD